MQQKETEKAKAKTRRNYTRSKGELRTWQKRDQREDYLSKARKKTSQEI